MSIEKKVYPDKTEYRLNGALHREDGPAVELVTGAKAWYQQGKLHRINGPAIEYSNGTRHWYIAGIKHREDGPAVELVTGAQRWYINGVDLTGKIEDYFKSTGFSKNYITWTPEEKLLFKLAWC